MSKKTINFILRIFLWVNALLWIGLLGSYILYTDSNYKKILEYNIYFTILLIHSVVFTTVAIMSRNSSSKFFLTAAIYFAFTTYIFFEMVAQDFFDECLKIGDLDVKICVLSKVFFGKSTDILDARLKLRPITCFLGIHTFSVLIYVIVFFTNVRTKNHESNLIAFPDVELAPLHKVETNHSELLQRVVSTAVTSDERSL